VHAAQADQLGAQLGGHPRGGGVGADDEQGAAAGEGVGQPRPRRGLFGLFDRASVDKPAMFGVLVDHGGIAVAQPQ